MVAAYPRYAAVLRYKNDVGLTASFISGWKSRTGVGDIPTVSQEQGCHREVESEGSWKQILDLRYTNRI